MAETQNVNNLIDYSKKDTIKKGEFITLYEGKINEESLKKLGDTLKLNQEQIVAVRAKLQTLIKTVKEQFLNPYSPKTQTKINGEYKTIENPITANLKNIEDRYDVLMSDLNNLNTVAARQISELLGLNANSIGDTLNANIINARKPPNVNVHRDYGVEQTPGKPVVNASEGNISNTKTASLNQQNPYPRGTMMGNEWEKKHAGQ